MSPPRSWRLRSAVSGSPSGTTESASAASVEAGSGGDDGADEAVASEATSEAGTAGLDTLSDTAFAPELCRARLADQVLVVGPVPEDIPLGSAAGLAFLRLRPAR